ncbi:gamma-secretase subunit Aph-1b-like isoform X4 [Gopherus flavomarginatus]|uniref:gamma-secretase subunit Aph-1b-like isoform X4 n=1 Tax=Gopherus flavomarginatus TaxID=286002 RepID=UPI0021CC481C|nr:gamma-secretase subunit Aph-1b-like isoform X4 [Gopherus flavomarginatus]
MTLAVFFGCSFIAFGPALGLCLFSVVREPLRVIILIAGKAIEGLVALSEDGCSPISIQQMAYVAGLGFGLMSGAFSMINLLADALGPGTVGIHGDSQLYFLTSAFMTMVMIFLHTFWGILFFHGCETQRWWEMVAVIFTHLIVSGLGSRVRQAPSQDPEGPSGALPLSCSLPALSALWCCQLGPTVAFSSFLSSVIRGPPFLPAGGRCPGAPAARE